MWQRLSNRAFPIRAFQQRLSTADFLTSGKQLGNNAARSHLRYIRQNTLDSKARIAKRMGARREQTREQRRDVNA